MASWVLKFNGHWDLSEMYTSELAVSFSCRIYRSIIRDAQTHIVHRRLRCWCLFAAWLFWHACYLSLSSCFFLKRRMVWGGPMTICFFPETKRKSTSRHPNCDPQGYDDRCLVFCFCQWRCCRGRFRDQRNHDRINMNQWWINRIYNHIQLLKKRSRWNESNSVRNSFKFYG